MRSQNSRNREFSYFFCLIQDSVLFWPLDPGSGFVLRKKSESGINIPDHIYESFVADPGSGAFLTLDPGSAATLLCCRIC
jgi:hypothetical protein